MQLAGFLRPFITCGLVLGLLALSAKHVTFRSRRVKRIGLVVIAWMVVLYTVDYLGELNQNRMVSMSAGHSSMFWIPLAALPAVVLAAFGWRAAARVVREAEP